MMRSPNGANPFGGLGGSSFPAPGVPGESASSTTGSTSSPAPSTTPGALPNLFPFGLPNFATPPATGISPASPASTNEAANPLANPFGFNPALMQQLMGGGGLGGGLGGFGGFDAPAAPTDTRPPEERFQVQLQV